MEDGGWGGHGWRLLVCIHARVGNVRGIFISRWFFLNHEDSKARRTEEGGRGVNAKCEVRTAKLRVARGGSRVPLVG